MIGLTAGLLEARHTVYSLVTTTGLQPTSSVAQFFYILVLVVVVSMLAYYTTRMVGSARFGRFGRRNLEVLESMGVGPQSFVHIMRVGEKYVLIGVTRGQVSFLTELEEGQLEFAEGGQLGKKPSFESFLGHFQNKEDNDNPPKQQPGGDN